MKNPLPVLFLAISILAACGPANAPVTVSPSPASRPLTIDTPIPTLSRPTTYPTETAFSKNGCIPPLVIGGYQTGEGVSTPVLAPEVLPVGWEAVSTLPEEYRSKYETYIKFFRPRPDHDEFWIMARNGPQYDIDDDKFYYYRSDTQEWNPAPTPPGFNIFLDGGNNVWASVVSEDKKDSVLYRLDESANQFIQVIDKNNELNNGYIQSSAIRVGNDGRFWFIFVSDPDGPSSLYSFDPVILEARRYISDGWYESLEIDAKGDIYIIQNTNTLIYYQPAVDKTWRVYLPPDDHSFGNRSSLYLDHDGRLWVSDRLWIDLSDLWRPYVIIRSPIFVDYIGYRGQYDWMRPSVLLESIDGRLWYMSASGRGNAWFKPETGEWCLFTTYGGNMVEDSDHNLWMMIENTLYRLQITQ